MALENITAGSTIADLDVTAPSGTTENVSEGDDHLINLKKAIKYTFPAVSATVVASTAELNFASIGGTVSGTAVFTTHVTAKAGVSVSATVATSFLKAQNNIAIELDTYTGNIAKIHPDIITAWTATTSGTGNYVLTHNLNLIGATDYIVVATGGGLTQKTAWVKSAGASKTKIAAANFSGVLSPSPIYLNITYKL